MKQPAFSASPCLAKVSRRGPRAARGFTLIEVVAAFAILALGLAMTMQIAAGGLQQTRQAADYTEAALLAQTLLDTAGVGEKLEIGETSGEWEGGFSWTLTVSPYELAELGDIAAVDPLTSPVRLVELDLAVRWERYGKQREAHYRSLRAMLPETL
ncbi:MAG: type IV pilus modification PilV family protein [Pseudomarimonas sp.]